MLYKLTVHGLGDVPVEVDRYPVLFIHMESGTNGGMAFL